MKTPKPDSKAKKRAASRRANASRKSFSKGKTAATKKSATRKSSTRKKIAANATSAGRKLTPSKSAAPLPAKIPPRSVPDGAISDRVLYLYAISPEPTNNVAMTLRIPGIDGEAGVETLLRDGYVCWFSRVPREEFADTLTERMEDLEWLAGAGLRHQQVVAEICRQVTALPARFATVFLGESSMTQHVRDRRDGLREALDRIADAEEWGVKIFASRTPEPAQATPPASGADYLKRKAASLQSSRDKSLPGEVVSFIGALSKLARDTAVGGKASTGQPGLLWHGSFLLRRKDRSKLEPLLRKYQTRWGDARRIECSGPWPPYSFVGEHGN